MLADDPERAISDTRLRRNTIIGAFQTFSGQGIRFVLQIISTIVLARLLSPEDFGLVAMVFVVTTFINIFRDIGLTKAAIQKEQITGDQLSSLFWINLAVCLGFAIVLSTLSPVVVAFYGRPELSSVVTAYAVILFVQGSTAIHVAILSRKFKYFRITIIEVVSLLIGVSTGIVLALEGAGYWSLVGKVGATSLAASIGYFLFSQWLPGRYVGGCGIRSLIAYGINISGFRIMAFCTRQVDKILIGWFWGASALGLYTKAYELIMLPVTQINGPATKVMLPALSRCNSEPDRFKKYYLHAIGLLVSVSAPLTAYMAISAHQIVSLVLGEQWLNVVPVFLGLTPAMLISLLNVTTGWIFQATGSVDRQLKWGLFEAPVHVAGIAIGLPFGPVGVAIAISTTFVCLRIPYLRYAYRGTSVSLGDLFSTVYKHFVAAVLSGCVTLFVFGKAREMSDPYYLLLSLLVFISCYLLLESVFFKDDIYKYIKLKTNAKCSDYNC